MSWSPLIKLLLFVGISLSHYERLPPPVFHPLPPPPLPQPLVSALAHDVLVQLGMMVDLSAQGMGPRCKRFLCVVEDGVVTHTRMGDTVELVSASAVEKVLSGTDGGERGPRKGGLFEKLLGREVEARAAEAGASGLLPVSYFFYTCTD